MLSRIVAGVELAMCMLCWVYRICGWLLQQ
jgi:hypothetical protein